MRHRLTLRATFADINNNISESSGLNIDTIRDFTSGEDISGVDATTYLGEASGTNAVNSAFGGIFGETILDT